MYKEFRAGAMLTFSMLALGVMFPAAAKADFNLTTDVLPSESGALMLNPPNGPYASNTAVTVTATNQPGFRFVRWSGDSSATTNRITLFMDSDKSVTALFTNAYTFSWTTRPAGAGSFSPNPVPPIGGYLTGTVVRLGVGAKFGFKFLHWEGDTNSTSNPIFMTMDTNKSVVAVFTNVPIFQLTKQASPTNGGTVTLSPTSTTGEYSEDAVVTATATPNLGFQFSHWEGDSMENTNRISVTMDTNKTLTAVFTNIPVYTLNRSASPAEGGSISASPSSAGDQYNIGAAVTLTASPNAGFRFSHWTGDSSATTNRITLSMDANKAVTAVFTNVTAFQLTHVISPTNGGMVTLNPAPEIDGYVTGTVVKVTATPNPGFRFGYWTGASSAATNQINVTMNTNKALTAVFTNVTTYKLTRLVSPPGSGATATTPNQPADGYVSGEVVMLTAGSENPNYKFSHWTGDTTSTDFRIFLTMNSNKTVTAVFTNVTFYSLDYDHSPEEGGTVTASPAPGLNGLPIGTPVMLTATPALGYKFLHWSGDSSATTNRIMVTMDTNKTYTAVFESASIVRLVSEVSPTNAGTITRTPNAETYTIDTVVRVAAAPNAGFRFSHWTGDSSATTNRIDLALDGDKNVTAIFTNVTTFQLTKAASPTNGGSILASPPPDFDGYIDGTEVELTAQDSLGFRFSHWTGDSTATTRKVTVTMSSDKSLTAIFTNVPMYQLISQVNPPGAGTVTPSGTNSYEFSSQVVLTTSPNAGFRFAGWTGAVVTNTNSVRLTMDGDKTVTANFTNVKMFQLIKTINLPGAGTISPTPIPEFDGYRANTNVMLSAVANQGFKFVRWSGATNTTTNRITLKMNTNKTIVAIFTNVPTVRLTNSVSPTNGGNIFVSAAPGPNGYSRDFVLTLKAVPVRGYKFVRWAGASKSTADTITLKMDTHKTITAIFTNLPAYVLTTTVTPSDAGVISKSPNSSSNLYFHGETVTLWALPYLSSTNYFGTWIGASSISNKATITMTGPKSVTAVFNNPGQFVFQNTNNGQLAIWFMNGTQRLSSVLMSDTKSPGVNWQLVGAADVNLNGSKDLFFRHKTSGAVAAWLMDGNVKTNSVTVRSAPGPYRVGAVTDFNGDHLVDVLWQHSNGAVNLWTINGTNFTTIPLGNPGLAWRPFAAVDLDTNSSPDILLQHTDGRVSAWLMQQTARIGSVALRSNLTAGATWKAAGATDLDSDGHADVIFQRNDGKVSAWFLNGTNFNRSLVLSNSIAPSWVLRAVK